MTRETGACAMLAWAWWPATAFAHDAGAAGDALSQAPVQLAQIVFALSWLGYAGGALRRAPRRGPRVAFHAAMVIGGLALFGPLDAWAERNVAWHMVQHMLLIAIVAPLLVLARPLPQWRALLGPRADALWRPLHRLSRRPLACALLHAAALWLWHAPGPYIAAVQTSLWHVLEHACFLASGWLFWGSVLRPGRTGMLPAAGALLFTAMHTGLLGALLTFAKAPLYSAGPTALQEQQLAGLVMWVPGGLAYLLAMMWVAWRWLASEESRLADAEVSATAAPHQSIVAK